jgi:hypothetical protein
VETEIKTLERQRDGNPRIKLRLPRSFVARFSGSPRDQIRGILLGIDGSLDFSKLAVLLNPHLRNIGANLKQILISESAFTADDLVKVKAVGELIAALRQKERAATSAPFCFRLPAETVERLLALGNRSEITRVVVALVGGVNLGVNLRRLLDSFDEIESLGRELNNAAASFNTTQTLEREGVETTMRVVRYFEELRK